MTGLLGGRGDLEGREGPGAPRSRCQGVPEVQVGRAGPGCSLPWDLESQGSQGGLGGPGGHCPQAHPFRLSVPRHLGLPSPPSFQLPTEGSQTETALAVRGGPLLLWRPWVPQGPDFLAILDARGGSTQQTHCCRKEESLEGLGVLEAPGARAFPSCQFQGWRLPAPLSLPSIHSSQGDPAVQESQSLPCTQAVHMDPGVLGSPALPWLLSGQGPGHCHQG